MSGHGDHDKRTISAGASDSGALKSGASDPGASDPSASDSGASDTSTIKSDTPPTSDDEKPPCCICYGCQCDYSDCMGMFCESCRSDNENTSSDEERPRPVHANGNKAIKYESNGMYGRRKLKYPRKLWLWVDEGVTELGYLDFESFQDLAVASRRDGKTAIATYLGSHYVPQKLLTAAIAYINNPQPRNIYVRCHTDNNVDYGSWWYNTSTEVDLLPFLITQLTASEKQTALAFLHPGPAIDGEPYPTFNYDLDTLVLDYGRCGEDDKEHDAYMRNIDDAVTRIAQSADANPYLPLVKHIEVTYCPEMSLYTYYNPVAFCNRFRALKGLQKLTLTRHNHAAGYRSKTRYYKDSDVYLEADAEEVKRIKFPFVIEFTDIDSGESGVESDSESASESRSKSDSED